jgi:hypothetical protein
MYCERGGQLLTRYVQSDSFVIRERLRLVLGEINTKSYLNSYQQRELVFKF